MKCHVFLGGGGGAIVGGGPILKDAVNGTIKGLSFNGIFSYSCRDSSGGLYKNKSTDILMPCKTSQIMLLYSNNFVCKLF